MICRSPFAICGANSELDAIETECRLSNLQEATSASNAPSLSQTPGFFMVPSAFVDCVCEWASEIKELVVTTLWSAQWAFFSGSGANCVEVVKYEFSDLRQLSVSQHASIAGRWLPTSTGEPIWSATSTTLKDRRPVCAASCSIAIVITSTHSGFKKSFRLVLSLPLGIMRGWEHPPLMIGALICMAIWCPALPVFKN